jgi:uncharacterized protein
MKTFLIPLAAGMISLSLGATALQPVPFQVPAQMPDRAEVLSPADVQLHGWLARRVAANETNRLVKVDLEPLLAGYRQKPGSHPWIGEHIGKWLHAATLAWVHSGDPVLREKVDHGVTELILTQESDGYLGTYLPEHRFAIHPGPGGQEWAGPAWDVWSHKYNLLGLLTYYQFTGHEPALDACRKMGDLLLKTFPAERSILAAGTHVGMAATSVLEPMVLLYRFTGEERYLEFCHYIVRSWGEPKGPAIIASLLDHGQVNRTANGKAYEMLSNLVGLCELARVTGDRQWLTPVLIAWQDIVDKRLYITGASSQGEHFRDDHSLPNHMGARVGEQCVTTTWIQLNWQLLRLTGESRFGDQLETVFYNQLAAAQHPDGSQWCYFTSPEGTKPYGPGINCCVSSGPRGMALIPQSAALRIASRDGEPETLMLNLWESMTVRTRLGGQDATVTWRTQFPVHGRATLNIESPQPAPFAIRLRVPAWAQPASLTMQGGATGAIRSDDQGYIVQSDDWTGTQVVLEFNLGLRRIPGEHGNSGWTAFAWGPFVLAFDQQHNPAWPVPMRVVVPKPNDITTREGGQILEPSDPLQFHLLLAELNQPEARPARLVTFADAGSEGGRYAIWLRAAGTGLAETDSLFSYADESRSASGNVDGSIADGDFGTFVVTFNGQPQTEAWFAVQRDQPVELKRVVFAHGRTFHDGGWFDASKEKPRLEIRRQHDGPWEQIAELSTYPATSATDPAGMLDGQPSTILLPQSVQAIALRVIGRPASGDNRNQAFASCAELQAFPE